MDYSVNLSIIEVINHLLQDYLFYRGVAFPGHSSGSGGSQPKNSNDLVST